MIPKSEKYRRFDPVEYNKGMDWAWKILGFEGKNPNRVPEPANASKKKKKDKKRKKK